MDTQKLSSMNWIQFYCLLKRKSKYYRFKRVDCITKTSFWYEIHLTDQQRKNKREKKFKWKIRLCAMVDQMFNYRMQQQHHRIKVCYSSEAPAIRSGSIIIRCAIYNTALKNVECVQNKLSSTNEKVYWITAWRHCFSFEPF